MPVESEQAPTRRYTLGTSVGLGVVKACEGGVFVWRRTRMQRVRLAAGVTAYLSSAQNLPSPTVTSTCGLSPIVTQAIASGSL